jgi:hypothetical protein
MGTINTGDKDMSKRYVTFLIILFLMLSIGAFLKWGVCKKYYYYSPDRTMVVTRLEYLPIVLPQMTYFIPDKHEGIFPPKAYVKPIYSGRDGGFTILMHWTDTSCIFYFPHGKYDANGLDNRFQLEKLSENSVEWIEMASDTISGKNKVLTEYKF